MICFVAFGAYVHCDPYEDRGNDMVAALCQMQIFFSLLASVALTSASDEAGTNMDVLLVVLYFLPVRTAEQKSWPRPPPGPLPGPKISAPPRNLSCTAPRRWGWQSCSRALCAGWSTSCSIG